MNDEILVRFICLHVHGGVVDLVGGGGEGEVEQNIPHPWRVNQDKFFFF
jgi:hypothetical protein